MQLHNARLCLDCNDVHDMPHCPACGSEAFAFLTRWIPASERRRHTRQATSPEAEVYREMLSEKPPSRRGRLLKRGAYGVGLLAAAGWLWQELGRRGLAQSTSKPADRGPDAAED